jgi:hypothetical protein
MLMTSSEDSVFPSLFELYRDDQPEPRDDSDANFLSLMKGWI